MQADYALGLEYYRNDSGKEFDGFIMLKADSIETLKLLVKAAAAEIQQRLKDAPQSFTPERLFNITNGTYFFHIMHKPTIDSMRKNMFDQEDLEIKDVTLEETLTEGAAVEPVPLQNDFFYDKNGDELPGLPDYWLLQAGLV